MATRLELHEEFCEVLGSRNAYYNPPPSVIMKYECIRYSKNSPSIRKANDKVYNTFDCYDGLVITTNPDSETPMKLLHRFPMCSLGRGYIVDNLYHFPFTIYY